MPLCPCRCARLAEIKKLVCLRGVCVGGGDGGNTRRYATTFSTTLPLPPPPPPPPPIPAASYPLIQPETPARAILPRCRYASLILKDDGVEVTAEAITAILAAAKVDISAESYYPGLFAKAIKDHDIATLTVVGGGGGGVVGGGGAAAEAGGDAAPAAAVKVEEKEESEEEDMGFGLFD